MKVFSVLIPFLCFAVMYFAFQYVLLIGHVSTDSMEPTIKKDSLILGFRLYKEFENGDIIIFEREGAYHVKRVKAVEGDEISCNGKWMQVPKGCCYVTGDNEESSIDSRFWEDPFIRKKNVKAILIYP